MCDVPNPELFNGLHEGVYLVDLNCRIEFWNMPAGTISGYSEEEVIGRRCADDILVHVDDHGEPKCANGCPLRQTMADGQQHDVEVYLLHKSGHRVAVNVRTTAIHDLAGNIVGGMEAFTACDRQGRRLNELQAIAFTDPLTSVANRRCLENYLARAVEDAGIAGTPLAVIMVDVNDFKPVNDTFGHAAGDAVLVTVARTLRESVRRTDFVARWGGDEFVIVLPNAPARIAAEACERIRALIRQARTHHEGKDIRVTVAAGYATLMEGDDAANLFQRADQQLYSDKANQHAVIQIRV
jgi:diguanylate cyclase (GGDEF)-like protein/PAS domain S-box-containing protein